MGWPVAVGDADWDDDRLRLVVWLGEREPVRLGLALPEPDADGVPELLGVTVVDAEPLCVSLGDSDWLCVWLGVGTWVSDCDILALPEPLGVAAWLPLCVRLADCVRVGDWLCEWVCVSERVCVCVSERVTDCERVAEPLGLCVTLPVSVPVGVSVMLGDCVCV